MRDVTAAAELASSGRVNLIAVVVAVTDNEPRVLAVDDGAALPSGPLRDGHRTLEQGLRTWVETQTGQRLGYVEQLYTFADLDRAPARDAGRTVSIAYLALAREALPPADRDAVWVNWYRGFPWEDWRQGAPPVIEALLPLLDRWSAQGDPRTAKARRERIDLLYGRGPGGWNDDLALERYELLYEARLVAESAGVEAPRFTGLPMRGDHRRILATAIGRLRGKLKYRPLVFELLPDTFTLTQMQRVVEALAGTPLHTQNFRRLVEAQGLVEETGARHADTGGRPAREMRFRREVVQRHAVTGTGRLPSLLKLQP